MKKRCILLAILCLTVAPAALAADYTFQKEDTTDYYQSTAYEVVHGSAYHYGGMNLTDVTDHSALLPGILSPSAAGTSTSGYGETAPDYASASHTGSAAYTPISRLLRKDGSIGTVTIASLGISMKVFEGTTDQSMDKGLGHFSDSSGWDGNVALCGHNRGSEYSIGGIRNMKAGDLIAYTTLLGTRQYAVTFAGTISSTDWSYVTSTADNRITLITCVENQPSLRIAVQAAEINEPAHGLASCKDKGV